MSDRAYLRDVQDRDETNLNARSALHERFSVTNRRRAIAEFEKVLKPDGVLYAVIIGCQQDARWPWMRFGVISALSSSGTAATE